MAAQPARILVVEDEVIVALDLNSALTRLGYTVFEPALSGQEALERALTERPDLILMDIRLQGDWDGIETTRRIHASLNIPVLFLSADTDDQVLQRALSSGAAGYLPKPFDEQELLIAIRSVLQARKNTPPSPGEQG